ncbi:hypothetical protein FOPG_12720 [Fusarium oxysporum f. sp. conglutinans race 2 54008]|uniref:Uncharacterized protein n=1 Tax=Fusarium oxysporum f. sp. conglutinans race 2 54008 TaxID=1089457 RepID=X0H5Y3_FUSOX|nr:hypothetical protein FOPG_12720 [Fusarium oxysporum f. sp. conglutinans race 2 54008]
MDARRVGSGLNGLAWVSANGEDISESRGEAESVLQRARARVCYHVTISFFHTKLRSGIPGDVACDNKR